MRQMMERQGITEELKVRDQMEWVRAVNNIRNAAEEIVLKELVYIESVESSFGSFLPFLQTIFSRAGKQSIYMEQMQREKILEGYDS